MVMTRITPAGLELLARWTNRSRTVHRRQLGHTGQGTPAGH